jgi:hypothetical protein
MTTRPFSRILMAVDGSFNAEAVARYAVRFAHASGASLHVLTVLSPRATGEEKDAAMASVERIVREGRETQIETTGLNREGGVPQIAAIALEEKIDLAMAPPGATRGEPLLHPDGLPLDDGGTSLLVLAVGRDPGRLAHPPRC